jgi:hypothetical protein
VIEVAAFVAWLGATVIVLSDGRRGLALGLALTTIAFAVLAWLVGGSALAAVALLLGGAAAAAQRLRIGREGWGLMPPGSTPRLVLSIAGGFVALWISTSVMTGPGAPLRFAALSVLGLMGARVLTTTGHTDALLTALAAFALSVAMAAGIADTWPGPSPFVVAALIAAGLSILRVAESDGA